ncbi:Signal transduction histidine kinase [Nocardioides scoriae]|uniref:Circadian input-output histidine kinase CikA n=1 Tax=Nocardioides scoriae TaxID=642780 RepID=A0A1H1LDL8_9ACTN|nr:GAF domain-containing protein [Nocardioides scoriae]SDR72664.1 Signal transduction histidine kinase [Nocardioides scoriae]
MALEQLPVGPGGERVVAPVAVPAVPSAVPSEVTAVGTPGSEADEPGPGRRQLVLTWLLAAAMAVAALLIAAPAMVDDPGAAVPGLRWAALVPLFALAEVVVIHLPTQRNAHGHTLREIPAVLGLTFLVPQQYVTAYVVGAVLALVVAARMGGVKLAFNAAMFALEAALGVLTYHAILQGGDPLSWTGWVAVLVAVLATDLISAAAVTAAISLTENAFDGEVLQEAMRSGSVAAFINTCVALLVATLVLVQPSALPLLGVVVVLLVLAYRVYIALARGHAQTQLLYRFVDRTSAARSLPEVVDIVLGEAADLMHAEHAYLVEVVDDHQVRCYASRPGGGGEGVLAPHEPDAWWWAALEQGVVQHERSRPGRRDEPEPVAAGVVAAHGDGLAAPLRGSGATRYVLLVCDRSFEKETFGTDDVQVFEALAAHAGVAVERARSTSDLEALADELAVARDAALAASEAKSLFLANMSHEIRTPLTTVLATAEILEDTDLDGLQVSLVEKMHRQGELLKRLVEGILDFSRIEAGELSLASTRFDLHAMVGDAAEVYEPRASASGTRFEWHLDPRVPRVVVGDPGRLFQVMTNLLDNALKFTHHGRVSLAVEPADAEDGTPGVALVVADTGIGIPEAAHTSIFEVFSQVDGSATRRYEGTGLGLAICRQLAELMGGTIGVESELGVGSIFTVRLPLLPVPGVQAVPADPVAAARARARA